MPRRISRSSSVKSPAWRNMLGSDRLALERALLPVSIAGPIDRRLVALPTALALLRTRNEDALVRASRVVSEALPRAPHRGRPPRAVFLLEALVLPGQLLEHPLAPSRGADQGVERVMSRHQTCPTMARMCLVEDDGTSAPGRSVWEVVAERGRHPSVVATAGPAARSDPSMAGSTASMAAPAIPY